ncbi:hypothetical protein DVH05_022902 [Phytophthora capsici]|nr:hypothetical protein DVH05_022902 [Phytophthora capsici]
MEKFAAQEDPDDLSEVYEGHLPEPRDHRIPMWNHQLGTDTSWWISFEMRGSNSWMANAKPCCAR